MSWPAPSLGSGVVNRVVDEEVRAVEERDRGSIVADLRSRIATISGGDTKAVVEPAEPAAPAGSPHVTVPDWLAGSLGAGGLPQGAVTAADDCPAALVDVLATLTASGGCAAVVGYPRLAVAAVEAAGGDLERLVLVPDPVPHASAVLGTLVEGLDLVVYAAPAAVSPSAARPVEARLRRSSCALLVCSGVRSWPGARLHLSWRTEGVTGLGVGSGRVRGVSVAGQAWGQGQPPRTFSGTVGTAATAAPALQDAPRERAL